MTSKQRISTRADSRDKKRVTSKFETNIKIFQIFYNNQKLMNLEIQNSKTVKDLNKLLKQKLKDRFYNYLGLESFHKYQVLDYAMMTKNYSLSQINQYQKFRILLQGQVHDLHIPTINDFIFLKLLGKGASSVVYLVRHKQNSKLYALKQVDKTYISDFKKMQFLLREKKILTEIVNKSSFASKIYATFESKDHLNFLLKYYPGGELFYHLQDRKFKQTQARLYFCQILLAIESLHKEKIIFRDLKPQNVLIDLNGNAVLSDFGLCKTNVKKQQLTISFCGSDVYMPPQMKEKVGYNYHADFYTLGAFLFQMITGLPPYYNSKSLNFPQNLSKQVIQLCNKLLENDLNKRICDFKKIKQQNWLKNIDWQMIKTKQYQMPIKLYPNKTYIHQDFRQQIQFKEIHEPIFDRLFDFFFWMSDNQNGISQCYVQQVKKINQIPEKNIQKNDKSKSKSHKDSLNKFNKIFQTIPNKKSQKILKKDKSSSKNQSLKDQKSKSMKKRSLQNSPYSHKVKNDGSLKKQTVNKNNERLSSKDSRQQFNIYQKNVRQVNRIQIKTVNNAISFNGRSFDSKQKNQNIQSPTFTKRKNF